MKTYLFIPLLAAGLFLSGCNIYYADQATKRGKLAFDAAKEANSHGDRRSANNSYRKAQLEFAEASAQDPRGTDRHYNLARASQALAEYSRAIREYAQAIKIFPGNGKAHSGMIECLVLMKASQRRIDSAVDTAVSIVPQRGRIYLAQAIAYYGVGRTEQVPPVLTKAAAAARNDSYIQARVGRLYKALGDFKSASRHLKRAYQINPQEERVAYDLGALNQELPPVVGQ